MKPETRTLMLRVLHIACATVAFVSVLPTWISMIYVFEYGGIAVLRYAGITILCAHIALFLRTRIYPKTENSGQFMTRFALIVGYVCALRGLYLCVFYS